MPKIAVTGCVKPMSLFHTYLTASSFLYGGGLLFCRTSFRCLTLNGLIPFRSKHSNYSSKARDRSRNSIDNCTYSDLVLWRTYLTLRYHVPANNMLVTSQKFEERRYELYTDRKPWQHYQLAPKIFLCSVTKRPKSNFPDL